MTDLDERLRQFEVVCKTACKIVGHSTQKYMHLRHAGGLEGIGEREFGLTASQVKRCVARARNFLWEVDEAARVRKNL